MNFSQILQALGLKQQFNDEPDKPGSFRPPKHGWTVKIYPPSDEYRIVEYPDRNLNRYGLQARVGDVFVDVLIYDNGCDDQGKLRAGKWVKLADRCSWQISSLKRLRDEILGNEEIPIPIQE